MENPKNTLIDAWLWATLYAAALSATTLVAFLAVVGKMYFSPNHFSMEDFINPVLVAIVSIPAWVVQSHIVKTQRALGWRVDSTKSVIPKPES
jgi:hypothetical protein